MQTVWDYNSSKCDHCALTAWNIPAKKYGDTVVALAQKGIWFLGDLGDVKVQALAHIADASAYFFSRLNHQTNIYDTVAGHVQPLVLVPFLHAVTGNIAEKDLVMGATAQVKSRLIVSRVPERSVHERRRKARKNAKKQGDTPSHAPLTL